MERYLITTEHTAEECRMAVKYFVEYHAGFLTHFEWGCKNNPPDHHAYALIDADSTEQALLSVPPLFRPKAKAIKVVQFEAKNARDRLHEESKKE